MTTFETTRTAPFGAVSIFRITTALDNARLALVNWNTSRVTRNALNRLSNRELNDIGLARGAIAHL